MTTPSSPLRRYKFRADRFGAALIAVRNRRDISLDRAAAQIGIGKATLWRVEGGGYAGISAEMLAKIATWMKKDPRDFFVRVVRREREKV